MIKNEREYKITKSRIADFERSLRAPSSANAKTIDPLIQQAQRDAILSQLDDLKTEITEYDNLRNGTRSVLELTSLEELPRALIEARVACGLTQRELAERLSIQEQQIQRYEATDYSSANWTRLVDVARALGISVREEVFLPQVEISQRRLAKRLGDAGLDSDFIGKHLLDRDSTVQGDSPATALRVAGITRRIFGWAPIDIFASTKPLPPPVSASASAYFKIHGNAQERRTLLIATYARYVASLALQATPQCQSLPVPRDPLRFREAILERAGVIDLPSVLDFLWQRGVVVVPLADGGGFHGACWRISGRNVIVLKQRTASQARWTHDLLHESYHAGAEPSAQEFECIDDEAMPVDRRTTPEEVSANHFAGNIMLDGRAEELAEKCVRAARSKVERLKAAVPLIASQNGVSVGALSNYVAWRLSLQGIDWWGAATNLQSEEGNPWQVVRDFLIDRLNWSVIDQIERDILTSALSENEDDQ